LVRKFLRKKYTTPAYYMALRMMTVLSLTIDSHHRGDL
jgi:hypothetical protein